MWSLLFKLSDGVLRIQTEEGPRYVALDRFERLYLLWVFRHFNALPVEVFPRGERAVQKLLARDRAWGCMLRDIQPSVIGTIDARPRRRTQPSGSR